MKRLIAMAVFVAVVTMSSLAFAADVYVTKNGKKFHTASCALIKNKETVKMDDSQAAKEGYKPCGKCFRESK